MSITDILLNRNKEFQIPTIQFYVTEPIGIDQGLQDIKWFHKNCGGGHAKIHATKKEEYVTLRDEDGKVVSASRGVLLPKSPVAQFFDALPNPLFFPAPDELPRHFYIGNNALTIECSCEFIQQVIFPEGSIEKLVKLARPNEKPRGIILKSIEFFKGEILFSRFDKNHPSSGNS